MEIRKADGTTTQAQVIGHTASHSADEQTRPIVRDEQGRKLIFIGFTLPPLRYAQILLLCEQEGCSFDEALASGLEPLFRAAAVAASVDN
jgi:hypothetical protein